MALITPQVFTAADIEGARKIRNRLQKTIPIEFDTDFFLARQWIANDGDLDIIEKRLKELCEHRKLLGYDRIDTENLENQLDIPRKTYERFSISPVACQRYSGNVCVYVQKMTGTDFKEILKVLPLSYVLHSYFILQESITRAILAKEAETGLPSAAASILDLEGLCLSDFINPLSGPTKLARLVVKIWGDYFKEGLVKLVLINPPGLVNVMWQIARFILDKKMISRVVILEHPSDLLKLFEPQVKAYGGLWRDDSGRADPPESVCRKAVRVIPQHYYDVNKIWHDHGFITLPEIISTSLKGKQVFEVAKKCEKDEQTLLWHFTVNGDIDFDIVCIEDDKEIRVWPKLTITVLKTVEQGALKCKKGDYVVRFTNVANSWIPLKLHYIIEISPL